MTISKGILASSKICSIGLSDRFKHGSKDSAATTKVEAKTDFMLPLVRFVVKFSLRKFLQVFKSKRQRIHPAGNLNQFGTYHVFKRDLFLSRETQGKSFFGMLLGPIKVAADSAHQKDTSLARTHVVKPWRTRL